MPSISRFNQSLLTGAPCLLQWPKYPEIYWFCVPPSTNKPSRSNKKATFNSLLIMHTPCGMFPICNCPLCTSLKAFRTRFVWTGGDAAFTVRSGARQTSCYWRRLRSMMTMMAIGGLMAIAGRLFSVADEFSAWSFWDDFFSKICEDLWRLMKTFKDQRSGTGPDPNGRISEYGTCTRKLLHLSVTRSAINLIVISRSRLINSSAFGRKGCCAQGEHAIWSNCDWKMKIELLFRN